MRFNKKHTCLEFLETGVPNDIYMKKDSWPVGKQLAFLSALQKGFDVYKNAFSKKVQYITQPFYDAFHQNRHKVLDALKSEPLGEVSGIFILQIPGGITKTMFYWFNQRSYDQFSCFYCEFTKASYNDIIALSAAIEFKLASDNSIDIRHYVGDPFQEKGIDHYQIVAEFMLMCGFLRYCDMEIKILKPKEKHRAFGVKYFNEEKLDIEILDSTWFTTIVREEGFKVRGHLRLQPYGPGMSQKRWIYIHDFEKHGYTRKAKMIHNDNP